MSQVIPITTPAITSNAATQTSDVINGLITRIRVDLRTAAGAASGNTATVTITDVNLNQDLLTLTGLTGIENTYCPQQEIADNTGTGTGLYMPINMITNKLTVTVASGTDTEFVRVFVELL